MTVLHGPWPSPPDVVLSEAAEADYEREQSIRRAYRQPWLRLQLDSEDNVAPETEWLCCECKRWFRLGELFYVRGERTICVWCQAP